MYLTKDEERVLDGEHGWVSQVAMRILVKLGDLFGADRLIPIHSAHLSGVSYRTLGDAATMFIEEVVRSCGRVKVNTTLNPSSFDLEKPQPMRLTEHKIEAQRKILKLYSELGVKLTLTCTPYYIDRPPEDTHLSWSESSAVVYANSVLGCWTNREGGPSALASAILGITPNYGMHKPEGRAGEIYVRVEADLKSEEEFGALGIYLGKILGNKIPVIEGLKSPKETYLKHLGAALASSGMTSRFIPSEKSENKHLEKISVERRMLEDASESLSGDIEDPELIFIGCPHCSYSEIREIAKLLEGKRVREDRQLWVCTSRHVRNVADEYVKKIENVGGIVMCDTCVVVSWVREAGIEELLTNSAKTAYYAPTMNRVKASLASLRECIDKACEK